MTKAERVKTANKIIEIVSSHGQKFFNHSGNVLSFELSESGHIWFFDRGTNKKIYAAYKGSWRHFSEGGTLRRLIDDLVEYIRSGEVVPPGHFGPWPDWVCKGDLWGYGESMGRVREEIKELGLP